MTLKSQFVIQFCFQVDQNVTQKYSPWTLRAQRIWPATLQQERLTQMFDSHNSVIFADSCLLRSYVTQFCCLGSLYVTLFSMLRDLFSILRDLFSILRDYVSYTSGTWTWVSRVKH